MKKAAMAPSDEAWYYKLKRGKYRHRMPIGKPVKRKRRKQTK
jgi:hypothetical protein